MSQIVIDLSGNVTGTPEEQGVSLANDMRLHDLNAFLATLNAAVDSDTATVDNLERLFNGNIARMVADVTRNSGRSDLALQVELSRAPSSTPKDTIIRARFSFVNTGDTNDAAATSRRSQR